MNVRFVTLIVFGCCVITKVVGAPPPSLERVADRAEELWRGDKKVELLKHLSSATARLKEDQYQALEGRLEQAGIPTVGQLLAQTRIALVGQGWSRQIPIPKGKELAVCLPEFHLHLKSEFERFQSHDLLKAGLARPEAFDDYKQRLWDIHVLQNELRTSLATAEYVGKLIPLVKRNRKLAATVDEKVVGTDYGLLQRLLRGLRDELNEIELETRIQRVDEAKTVLRTEKSFFGQLDAAFVADLDLHHAIEFVKSRKGKAFQRPSLQDANLALSLAEKQQELAKNSGLLVKKGRLFFEGMHWWYRGRYGYGSAGFGMLKSRMALANPAAQFALFMPRNPPVPSDPSEGKYRTHVDRRHHYIWMYEHRQVQSSYSDTSRRKVDRKKAQEVTLKRFY